MGRPRRRGDRAADFAGLLDFEWRARKAAAAPLLRSRARRGVTPAIAAAGIQASE